MPRSMVILFCALITASLVLQSDALAQPQGGQPGRGFGEGFDDGPPPGRFGQGPGGQRGGSSFGQLQRPGGSAVLDLFDADHDGELSTKEMEDAAAVLKKLDTDADGKLTVKEVGGAGRGGDRPDRGPPRGEPGREPGREGGPPLGPGIGAGFDGPPPGGPGGFGRPGGGGNRQGIGPGNRAGNRADARPMRGDGPSSDELVSQALEFDADHDGKLDKEELAKFAAKMAVGPREREGREGGRGGRCPAPQGGGLPRF